MNTYHYKINRIFSNNIKYWFILFSFSTCQTLYDIIYIMLYKINHQTLSSHQSMTIYIYILISSMVTSYPSA